VERQREIGLVRAMGASSWRVAEGLALGGISWCLGALLGLPLASAFLQLFSRMVIPVDFVVDPLAFLVMLAALLLIVTLASVVPARRASSLHIADLLRYE
jgi:putative ABC transport system permease protein